jgi:hypothetical protein
MSNVSEEEKVPLLHVVTSHYQTGACTDVEGVFSTKEKAEAAIREYKITQPDAYYTVQQFGLDCIEIETEVP